MNLDSPLWQIFLTYVLPVLLTGLLLLLAFLAAKAAQWAQAKVKENRLWGALELAQRWAFDALLFAGTEFKAEYQRLVADGDLSAEDRTKLRDLGVGVFKKWLGQSKAQMLSSALGLGGIQLEQFLTAQVERAMVRLPGVAASVSTAAAVVSAASALPGVAAPSSSSLPFEERPTPALGVPVVSSRP